MAPLRWLRHPLASRARNIGIVPRLLIASLLAVVVAVGAVQAWTLRMVYDAEMQAAQKSLEIHLSLLRRELATVGTDWHLGGDGTLLLGGTPLNGRNDIVDEVSRTAGGVATIFAGDTRVATSVRSAGGERTVGTRLAAGPAHEAVLGRGETYRGSADILGTNHLTIYEPVKDARGQPIGILFVGVSLAQAQATILKIVHQGLVAGLLVVVVVGAVRWSMLHRTMRPLSDLAASVRSIAEGKLDHPAPCADRTDQLGQIGKAIEVLRAGALRARDAEERKLAERAVKDRRQEAMDRLTSEFGATVSAVLGTLTQSASGMRRAADTMARTAEETRHSMESTAEGAGVSAQSLSTVASAAEELTASVGEISRQVGEAATATRAAVARARETDTTVEGLRSAVGQIGEVVKLISDIAAQTNLLALNATIEAARAGEAGKGFAVVAAEVKQLANQTAEATGRIGTQVDAIQAATVEAVTAMRGVVSTIDQVSEIAGAIAAAVDQQGVATREIAGQVQGISQLTGEATRAMRGVCDTAERSGTVSREVLDAADQVAGQSDGLRQEVDHFLDAVRANQNSEDRRRYVRVPGNDAPVRLRCATRGTGTATLRDLSLGGAALVSDWSCDVGQEVLVGLPGEAEFVTARVVNAREGLLAVSFRQDPATLDRITHVMEGLSPDWQQRRMVTAAA